MIDADVVAVVLDAMAERMDSWADHRCDSMLVPAVWEATGWMRSYDDQMPVAVLNERLDGLLRLLAEMRAQG